jgi:hypothetical protein
MSDQKTDFSTPDIPQSTAVFHVSARTHINAPASLVFRTLRNTETWKDWNRWVPKVTITEQPDDEDDATIAEIEELVRNTSLAVNLDSDITDGAAPGKGYGHSEAYRRASGEFDDEETRPSVTGGTQVGGMLAPPGSRPGTGGGERPNSPPAVTRQRLASNASRLSSDTTPRNNSTTSANGAASTEPAPRKISAAQKFQAAQEARRGSIALHASNALQPVPGEEGNTNGGAGVLLPAPGNNNILMAAPQNTHATQLAAASRRKSTASTASTKQRRQLHINALYGEPSVRIQLNTKLTLHMRMKIPSSLELTDQRVVVTEVSRPEDPTENEIPISQLGSIDHRAMLLRTQTHTSVPSRPGQTPSYRLIWTSASSTPKFMFFSQRVHEIRPSVDGAGNETCVYWDWECQRGVLAKKNVKTKKYMEERMREWGVRLGEFCESMGGAVERRDFMVA